MKKQFELEGYTFTVAESSDPNYLYEMRLIERYVAYIAQDVDKDGKDIARIIYPLPDLRRPRQRGERYRGGFVTSPSTTRDPLVPSGFANEDISTTPDDGESVMLKCARKLMDTYRREVAGNNPDNPNVQENLRKAFAQMNDAV